MITIFHVPQSRSLRVVWLMEELGEEYLLEKLSFSPPRTAKFRQRPWSLRTLGPFARRRGIDDLLANRPQG